MNTKVLFVCYLTIFLCIGCDKASEPELINNTLVGSWDVVNISGGFAGIDDDFEDGAIIWEFGSENNTLTIQNDNDSNNLYDGLETGNYSYSILEMGGNSFLVINETEFGAIVMAKNELVIDQNNMSDGSGADKFVIKLAR